MSPLRPLWFRRNERHVVDLELSVAARVDANKTSPMENHVDHHALLRMSTSPSTRAGNVIDLMSERSRVNCASMRSQF